MDCFDGDVTVFPDIDPENAEHGIIVRKRHRIRSSAFTGADAPTVVSRRVGDILPLTFGIIKLVGQAPRLAVTDKLDFIRAERRKRNKSADRKKEYH